MQLLDCFPYASRNELLLFPFHICKFHLTCCCFELELYFIFEYFEYLGITGAIIKIDKNGDSEGNYSVLAIQPYLSAEPVRDNFSCNYLMTPVAHFQQGNDFPVSFER